YIYYSYPCSRCNINSLLISNYYTYYISATLSTKFLGRKKYNNTPNKLKLNAHYLDLLYLIALKNLTNLPPLPSIIISQSSVYTIFYSNPASHKLEQFASDNQSSSNFTFYTN